MQSSRNSYITPQESSYNLLQCFVPRNSILNGSDLNNLELEIFKSEILPFMSEAKLVEVGVTLLMGSQSACCDPYSLPSSFKTNSP